MSEQMFSGLANGGGIAGIDMDGSEVSGIGGAVYPRIQVPAKLLYYSLSDKVRDYVLTTLNAQLLRDGKGKLADALPIKLGRVQRTHKHYTGPESLWLEFPIDVRRLTEMERYRDGGDLALRFEFELTIEEHGPIQGDPKAQRPPSWGVCNILNLVTQFTVTIPRSTWVERVLPNTGFGVVHMIELPAVPIENCRALGQSYEALRQAQSLHAQGCYDMAVVRCRTALDPFFKYVLKDPSNKDSAKIPELDRSWETRLGSATYLWLNEVLSAIKSAANPTVHNPASHFDQIESQMIHAITTTVVSYAARTMTTGGKE